MVDEVMGLFGRASGLVINRDKCAAFPVRCTEVDLTEVLQDFPCQIKAFPCTWLAFALQAAASGGHTTTH